MSAPTPGPWKTGREDMQSYTGDGEIAFTNIYQGSPSQTIARAEGNNNKADAKLIAAAPDLLRELLQVRDAIIGPSIDRTARDRLVTVGQRMELSLDRINTALKKAGL